MTDEELRAELTEIKELMRKMMSSCKDVMDSQDAAFYLNVSTDRIRHLVGEKAFPVIKKNGRNYMLRQDLDNYKKSGRRVPSMDEIKAQGERRVFAMTR